MTPTVNSLHNINQSILERLLFYVPKEINIINKEMQASVNKIFRDLHKSYLAHPQIRKFLPSRWTLQVMSSRAIVLQTASDIFRLSRMVNYVTSKQLHPDHLHKILNYVGQQNINYDLVEECRRGKDVQGVRVALKHIDFPEPVKVAALLEAVPRRHLPMVLSLRARGVDTQATEDIELSLRTHPAVVEELLDSNLEPKEYEKRMFLIRAVDIGDLQLIKRISSRVILQCRTYQVAYLYALEKKKQSIVPFLTHKVIFARIHPLVNVSGGAAVAHLITAIFEAMRGRSIDPLRGLLRQCNKTHEIFIQHDLSVGQH